MRTYAYQPSTKLESFQDGISILKSKGYKVIEGGIDNTAPDTVYKILELAKEQDLNFEEYLINIEAYRRYCQKASYAERYPSYYSDNFVEKSLEHYIAFDVLNLNDHDVFIDIASEHSPVPEIFARLTGAKTYSQDIMYPEGIHGTRIGGTACSMPIPDAFASKATLTCSFEHFEDDDDIGLFHELHRILKPGGAVCVVPFYVFPEAAVQTDPTVSVPANVNFDHEMIIYCVKGWRNRFGRFYSPESFKKRIVLPMIEKFRFRFYLLINTADVDFSAYARFAFAAVRL